MCLFSPRRPGDLSTTETTMTVAIKSGKLPLTEMELFCTWSVCVCVWGGGC